MSPSEKRRRQRRITAYRLDYCYGGPEEGGWWWSRWEVLESRVVRRGVLLREQAALYARHEGLIPTNSQGVKREYTSVLGGVDVQVMVETRLGEFEVLQKQPYS